MPLKEETKPNQINWIKAVLVISFGIIMVGVSANLTILTGKLLYGLS